MADKGGGNTSRTSNADSTASRAANTAATMNTAPRMAAPPTSAGHSLSIVAKGRTPNHELSSIFLHGTSPCDHGPRRPVILGHSGR